MALCDTRSEKATLIAPGMNIRREPGEGALCGYKLIEHR